MAKRLINILVSIFFGIILLPAQESIGYSSIEELNLEDTNQYKYFKIDTTDVWFITDSSKTILFFTDDNAYPNKYHIITNDSYYYKEKIDSWFQIKVVIGFANEYIIGFTHKYDFEENVDGGFVEVSHDNELTWNNVISDSVLLNWSLYTKGFYTLDDTLSSYNNKPGFTGLQESSNTCYLTFSTDASGTTDTLLFRFHVVSDSVDLNNEGWILDNLFYDGVLVGVEENKPSEVQFIFPIPTHNILYLNLKEPAPSFVRIITMHGETIMELSGDIQAFDVGELTPGIYFLRIDNVCCQPQLYKFIKL